MAIKVIGAGLPRTGTASLKSALEILGYNECQHMETLFNNPHLVDYWVELFKTGTTDFDALFDGFKSTTDFPGALLYKELLGKYPDAKVILGVRDPEEWYESASRTVYAFTPKTFKQKLKLLPKKLKSQRFRNIAKTLRMVEVYLWKDFFEGEFPDKAKTIARFKAFEEEVREHVPSEQLLEYQLGSGWKPLCDFLDVPVPKDAYPHRNQRDKFIAQLSKMMSSGGQLKIK
ncbi:MAG TPA: sulfotransferase [Saprospiraceae bacterium]|nr:sulfotransferase [Saprospiraceae bacterium]